MMMVRLILGQARPSHHVIISGANIINLPSPGPGQDSIWWGQVRKYFNNSTSQPFYWQQGLWWWTMQAREVTVKTVKATETTETMLTQFQPATSSPILIQIMPMLWTFYLRLDNKYYFSPTNVLCAESFWHEWKLTLQDMFAFSLGCNQVKE